MRRHFLAIAIFASAMAASARMSAAEPATLTFGTAERVRTGFIFTEGPASDGKTGLYFTDVPAQRIYHLTSADELTIFRQPSNLNNGLFQRGPYLYGCEQETASVVRFRLGDVSSREVLAKEFQGVRFNSPNDLVVDKQGGVYFTDPEYNAPKPWPQKVRSVYYIAPDRVVTRVVENLPNPNGIILSPDETKLYVAPSSQAEVMVYDVLSPGKLGTGRPLVSLKQAEGEKSSGGDGVTIDTEGNLYVTSDAGVQVISPEGKILAIIEVPEIPANCTFAGEGRHTLYITARTSVYRLITDRTGHSFNDH